VTHVVIVRSALGSKQLIIDPLAFAARAVSTAVVFVVMLVYPLLEGYSLAYNSWGRKDLCSNADNHRCVGVLDPPGAQIDVSRTLVSPWVGNVLLYRIPEDYCNHCM
jgi:hypothetical protein